MPPETVLVIGDSRINASAAKALIATLIGQRNLTNLDPTFTAIVSGQRISQYIENPHPDEADADVIMLSIGINDYLNADPAGQITGLVDYLETAAPDATLVWQSEFSHLPTMVAFHGEVTAQRIKDGTVDMHARQLELSSVGRIYLTGWADANRIDPVAYTTADFADGVHVYGNEDVYVDSLFEKLDEVPVTSDSPVVVGNLYESDHWLERYIYDLPGNRITGKR